MPLIVDGDNLLGTWPGRRRSDGERRTLAFELHRWARERGKRVVVVFDGVAPPGTTAGRDVLWSGAGRRADDVIVERLRRERDPRGWTVVTSDRALGDRCRHLGARAQRSDRFRPELTSESAAEKPDHEPDVEGWLQIFGESEADDD